MKVRNIVAFVLILLPSIFLSSCGGEDKKDDPAPAVVAKKCLLAEVNQDSTYWQKNYFDANDLLVKFDWKSNNSLYTTSYVYNSQNQVVEQTQAQTNGPSYFYTTYSYNTFGRWQQVQTYIKQNNTLVLHNTQSYTFSPSGQLQRKDVDNNYTGSPSTYTTYSFNNSQVVANSYSNTGVLFLTEEFEFDNNKTPSADVIASTYANEFFIPHNVIKYNWKHVSLGIDPTRSYSAVMKFNADGYPTERVKTFSVGNVSTQTYIYNCR